MSGVFLFYFIGGFGSIWSVDVFEVFGLSGFEGFGIARGVDFCSFTDLV